MGLSETMMEIEQEESAWLENNKNLKAYFESFKNANVVGINGLTTEACYTLKQFLYEDYLSVSQITNILQNTAPHHVKEKIDKFLELGLIKKTNPSASLPKSRHNNKTSKYYKLTSIGLFYLLIKIDKNDVRVDPSNDCRVKIFNIYENDPLFQIFIHSLIDKELLCRITEDIILWEIINYIKQVCQVIDNELKIFREFYKNGKIEERSIKWNYNLKDNRAKWDEFCQGLVGSVILVPCKPGKYSIESIVNTYVSSNRLSFECANTKYSIEMDEQNSKAKLLRNDKEYENIPVKRARNCFILYRTKYWDEREFLLSMFPRFWYSVDHLKFQFGFSILQLFDKPDGEYFYFLSQLESERKYHSILKELAKDERIRQLIGDINDEFKEHYEAFIGFSK